MKNKRFWNITPVEVVLGASLLLCVGALYFWDPMIFYVALGAALVLLGVCIWRFGGVSRDIRRYLSRVAGSLNQAEQDSLAEFPLPVAVVSAGGEVIWYNDLFRQQVLDGDEAYGDSVGAITGGASMRELQKQRRVDVVHGTRRFTVYTSPAKVRDSTLLLLYYVDDTTLKETAEEYALSRPAVMVIYIDNIEELTQNVRDSERARMAGQVETILEDWLAPAGGILRKYGSDRFLAVVEQRHLDGFVERRFDVLDRVRSVQTADGVSITLSVGIGQGDHLREAEEKARQAIEMALGRGGDQAALKTANGFDFFGGVSKGVERRARVRTRVVASALSELIVGSDQVLVMGHRFSDLDCLGAAAAMAAIARSLSRPAFVVTQRAKTLAPELIDRYAQNDRSELFVEPQAAMDMLTRKTLLIITDTHNPKMLEWEPLYREAASVVVIDHHRKMVDHIDNAVIFYHEPYASSASEMVAELAQYMGNNALTRLEAEALLAGIMLDTRSFVMKAGVRTFEAAAYLRRLGADTVEVKRMFSGSMEMYRKKSAIVAGAELYRGVAISCDTAGGAELRVAAAQAADELLAIKGVLASFALFEENGGVNISARSLGDFNVQLVMEAVGGGGHLTMAGAYLENTDMPAAKACLVQAIDAHLEEREHSLASQLQKTEH